MSQADKEIAALKAAARTLKLLLPAAPPSVNGFAKHGLALKLEGPAGRKTRVRLRISAAKARRLGLKWRTIATRNPTIGAGGTVSFTIKPSTAAASALEKHASRLALQAEAVTGDRRAHASAVLGG